MRTQIKVTAVALGSWYGQDVCAALLVRFTILRCLPVIWFAERVGTYLYLTLLPRDPVGAGRVPEVSFPSSI